MSSSNLNHEDKLLIFDGVCNFCTKSVQFVLRHEADQSIRFAPLQSATGTRLMREFGFDPGDAETFVLVTDGVVLTKSDAALALAKHLRGGWRFLRIFRVVPRPVRDWLYGVIARNRYRWFGKYDSCMVPTPELQHRFVTD